MSPEERALLTGLLERVRATPAAAREPEAGQLIDQALHDRPDLPYLLAQGVLVQDQALRAAQARIAALEAAARPAASAPASFLGTGNPWAVAAPAAPAPAITPAPAAPAGSAAGAGAGGFLRGAMQAAAGLAGGALLFEGVRGLLHGSPFGWGGGFASSGFGAPAAVEETVINQYGTPAAPDPAGWGGAQDAASDAADEPGLLDDPPPDDTGEESV